jgi:hypothetical protein
MTRDEKKWILEGYYLSSIQLYNIAVLTYNEIIDIPSPTDFLYNQEHYIYAFNIYSTLNEKTIENKDYYNYIEFMIKYYPEGYGYFLKMSYENKISSKSINLVDLFFELRQNKY